LAATTDDGVYRTSDRGQRWECSIFGLVDLNVFAIAFATAQRVIVGTETGVFLSKNDGLAWRETAFSMDDGPVLCLAAAEDGTLYAGTESSGSYISSNDGRTWRTIAHQGTLIQQLQVLDQRVFAPLPTGIDVSTDGGETWETHVPATKGTDISAFCVADRCTLVGHTDGTLRRVT
jgi:photosystem II stability/assembly factor-like uncharacterized protein